MRPSACSRRSCLVHARPVVEARQIRLGDQADEIAVALLRRREDGQVVGVALARLARRLFLAIRPVAGSDVRLDADDRADAVLKSLVEEVEGPEHVAVVGDRDRRHAELGDALAQLGQSVGAVEEGVLAVEMEVDEVAGHRASIIRRSEKEADDAISSRRTPEEKCFRARASRCLLAARPSARGADPVAVRRPRRGVEASGPTSAPTSRPPARAATRTFAACFAEQMRVAGASAAALAFLERTGNQGYLTAFVDAGKVDIAYAEYPFRANENAVVFLVNGEPSMLDVDDLSRIDRKNLEAEHDLRGHSQEESETRPLSGRAPSGAGAARPETAQRRAAIRRWSTSSATAAMPARTSAMPASASTSTSRANSSEPTSFRSGRGMSRTHAVAFRRALGTFDATMLVVGGIIGAGIFVNPYLVAQRLPVRRPHPRDLDRRRRHRPRRSPRLRRARLALPARPAASTPTCARPITPWSPSSSAGPPS